MNSRDPNNIEGTTDILLVTGFLGAGKTTFLKYLLSMKKDMSDTIVIVNEFGDIGIDGALLRRKDTDVIELTSGCICCTMAIDLTVLLTDLWNRFNPHYIIIECSGIADPFSLIPLFHKAPIKDHVRYLKTVTVLDADCWKLRHIMGRVLHHQLQAADMILLNKVDLLDNSEVKKNLKEMRESLPHISVVPTIFGRIDWESIWATRPFRTGSTPKIDSSEKLGPDEKMNEDSAGQDENLTVDNHEHAVQTAETGFITFSFRESRPINRDVFKKIIKELPPEIFRIKGPVHFQDETVFFNFVGGRTDWVPWDDVPETSLSFVGWDTDIEKILSEMKNCIIS
jgi:G3E family GTPase